MTDLNELWNDWFTRSVEVVCSNDAHAPGVHVAWLYPDAPTGTNGVSALLVGNEPLPTVRAALVRQRSGETVRGWHRFVCPVCGERGATPEARAEVLAPIISRAAGLGVSRLDIYSLERYISG